jgi:hypothetical protein
MIDVLILTDMPGPCSPTFAAVGSNVKVPELSTRFLTLSIVILRSQEKASPSTVTDSQFLIVTVSGPEIYENIDFKIYSQ